MVYEIPGELAALEARTRTDEISIVARILRQESCYVLSQAEAIEQARGVIDTRKAQRATADAKRNRN